MCRRQGGLASPRIQDLSLLDIEIDAAERLGLAKAFDEPAGGNDRVLGQRPHCRVTGQECSHR